MGKKKPPKPPVITPPKPTAQEQALTQSQIDLVHQLTTQGAAQFQQGTSDREKAFQIYDTLQQAPTLSPEEQNMLDQISNSYLDTQTRAINEGQREYFDTQRRDTLASLAARGIINSTTASDAFGGIEKERLNLLAQAGSQAALARNTLNYDYLTNKRAMNQNLFNTLLGQGGNQIQLGGGISQGALSGAGNVSNQLNQQRMDAFNVAAQNAQANYAYQLGLYNQQKSFGSRLLGGLTGTFGGALAGGMAFGAPGAIVGGSLGGTIGLF